MALKKGLHRTAFSFKLLFLSLSLTKRAERLIFGIKHKYVALKRPIIVRGYFYSV